MQISHICMQKNKIKIDNDVECLTQDIAKHILKFSVFNLNIFIVIIHKYTTRRVYYFNIKLKYYRFHT